MSRLQTATRQALGWDQIVETLKAATDLTTFHNHMLDLQCKIVAADYGAIWTPPSPDAPAPPVADASEPSEKAPAEPPPVMAGQYPPRLAQQDPESRVMVILRDAAISGFKNKTSHLLRVEGETSPSSQAYVFVTVMRRGGQVAAVTTAVARVADQKVIQTTAPLREVAAGLYESFFTREQARQSDQQAQRIRRALALLTTAQEAQGFKGTCLSLVQAMAQQYQAARVSLGWVKGKAVKLVAISDTEDLKRHSEQVALTELAMCECMDQQQPVVYPIPPDAEPLLQHAVVYAHRRMAGQGTEHHVVSIPLRMRDDWVAVLTLERSGQAFDAGSITQLQLIADTITPHLVDRKRGDRWVITHAWHSIETFLGYLVGPKHVAWKLGAVALLVLVAWACLGTMIYRVSAPFTVHSVTHRVVPSPFQGTLDEVSVEPGQIVHAGQTLARFNTRELDLELIDLEQRHRLLQLEKAQAYADDKIADAQQAQAKLDQTRAKMELIRYRLEQARLVSPIDGVIMEGDWRDRIGGVVPQGEKMFQIAPVDQMYVELRVGEADINFVRENQIGRLATRSRPEEKLGFEITTIVPAAGPIDGNNVFEVRAKLTDQPAWIRSGMEGIARIQTRREPIYWVLTHRVTDTVRVWLWL